MSDSNEIFTPEQNLAYIREVMAKAKRTTSQAGPFLAGWGIAAALGNFLQYLVTYEVISFSVMPFFWVIFGVGGGIASSIYGRKLERESGPVSLNETITVMLFSCIGITLGLYFAGIILGFVFGFRSVITAAEIGVVIASVMAIVFFVASFSTGIKWFRVVAMGWWAAMIIALFNPLSEANFLLFIAILDLALLAFPGFILMSIAKQNSHQE